MYKQLIFIIVGSFLNNSENDLQLVIRYDTRLHVYYVEYFTTVEAVSVEH